MSIQKLAAAALLALAAAVVAAESVTVDRAVELAIANNDEGGVTVEARLPIPRGGEA